MITIIVSALILCLNTIVFTMTMYWVTYALIRIFGKYRSFIICICYISFMYGVWIIWVDFLK